MTTRTQLMIATSLLSMALSAGAMAQNATTTAPVTGHPRVGEVEKRINTQEKSIDRGLANGTLTADQAARDEKHDAAMQKQLEADEAKNGGHLTRDEQHRLNREAKANATRMHEQKKESKKLEAEKKAEEAATK